MTAEEWKGLWAILWRFLILGPLLLPLGLCIFALIVAIVLGPFGFAIHLFLTDRPLRAILVVLVWATVLRKSRRLFEKLLEGIEHAGN